MGLDGVSAPSTRQRGDECEKGRVRAGVWLLWAVARPVESPKLTLFHGRVHGGVQGWWQEGPHEGGGVSGCLTPWGCVCCFLTVEMGSSGPRKFGVCLGGILGRTQESSTCQGPHSLPRPLSGTQSRLHFPSKLRKSLPVPSPLYKHEPCCPLKGSLDSRKRLRGSGKTHRPRFPSFRRMTVGSGRLSGGGVCQLW